MIARINLGNYDYSHRTPKVSTHTNHSSREPASTDAVGRFSIPEPKVQQHCDNAPFQSVVWVPICHCHRSDPCESGTNRDPLRLNILPNTSELDREDLGMLLPQPMCFDFDLGFDHIAGFAEAERPSGTDKVIRDSGRIPTKRCMWPMASTYEASTCP